MPSSFLTRLYFLFNYSDGAFPALGIVIKQHTNCSAYEADRNSGHTVASQAYHIEDVGCRDSNAPKNKDIYNSWIHYFLNTVCVIYYAVEKGVEAVKRENYPHITYCIIKYQRVICFAEEACNRTTEKADKNCKK